MELSWRNYLASTYAPLHHHHYISFKASSLIVFKLVFSEKWRRRWRTRTCFKRTCFLSSISKSTFTQSKILQTKILIATLKKNNFDVSFALVLVLCGTLSCKNLNKKIKRQNLLWTARTPWQKYAIWWRRQVMIKIHNSIIIMVAMILSMVMMDLILKFIVYHKFF